MRTSSPTPAPSEVAAHLEPSHLGPSQLQDAELVARALTGDRWATSAIFRRHVGSVTGLVRKSFGRTAEADDIVQDTFAIALDDLPKLKDRNALRSWLLGIAVHQMHRRFSRRRLLTRLGFDRTDYVGEIVAMAAPSASPEDKAELRLLAEAMEKLPPADRIAWTLRHAHGHPLADVAQLTSCSLATVKRRITRADVALRAHVGLPPRDGEEDDDA